MTPRQLAPPFQIGRFSRMSFLTSRTSPIYTRARCPFTQNIHALNLNSLGTNGPKRIREWVLVGSRRIRTLLLCAYQKLHPAIFSPMQHCYILIARLARPQSHLLECHSFQRHSRRIAFWRETRAKFGLRELLEFADCLILYWSILF
jgi:hypothetical protein